MVRTVTKDFTFDMAHRLIHGYEGKCKNIHGHTYKCSVTIEAEVLDDHGFVIDFGEISKLMKSWVMDNLDHAMIVDSQDLQMRAFLDLNQQKCFVLPQCYKNTTAENISTLLMDVFNHRLQSQRQGFKLPAAKITEVKVWETPTSCASTRRE